MLPSSSCPPPERLLCSSLHGAPLPCGVLQAPQIILFCVLQVRQTLHVRKTRKTGTGARTQVCLPPFLCAGSPEGLAFRGAPGRAGTLTP